MWVGGAVDPVNRAVGPFGVAGPAGESGEVDQWLERGNGCAPGYGPPGLEDLELSFGQLDREGGHAAVGGDQRRQVSLLEMPRPFRSSSTANLRCEIAFFCLLDISANVRSLPAGTKMES